jgi:hypothetical protein
MPKKELPIFAIQENWMVSETRYYQAKDEAEAKRLSGTSGWLGIGEGPQFEEFHGIQSVKRMDAKEIADMNSGFRATENHFAELKKKGFRF